MEKSSSGAAASRDVNRSALSPVGGGVGRILIFLARIALIGVELGLLLFLIRSFSIENDAYFRVFALAVGGFLIHAVLPLRVRLPFFVLLSIGGIVLIFGPVQGTWLTALGALLIGIAHLPVRFGIRVVLILAVGGWLAVCRAGLLRHPWSADIWPVLGAMFMFRMIVYLYDLRNRAAPFSPWRSAAYFFMLPNVNFTLFPVVDYKTFVRGYYGVDPFVTYQTGVNWILRGLLQLILYRAVYQYLPSDPALVGTATAAALYFVRPYLLYLRISGSFHLVIGILHLFGFNLPRTNYNYLLASSFTDYWRRVNIYWKDFLQKIFFNPFYLRFKRSMNATAALITTTCIAFFATWALHSYQWFWIRGSFPVIWQDIVFWSIMGFLVLGSMMYEERHGRTRRLGKAVRSPRSMLGLALRTIATFLVISASWALWSTESFGELALVAGKLFHPGARDILWIVGGLLGLGLAAVVYDRFETIGGAEVEATPRVRVAGIPVPVSAFRVIGLSAGLLCLVFAQLYVYYPPTLANVVGQVRNPLLLNARDAQMLTRGYYEDLADVSRFNPELAELFANRPADWHRCWAIHRTGGFPSHEILPSRRVQFKGAMMTTNRWRMRDRDYEKAKPAGTYRFALLGSSHAMGSGVEDNGTFENIVEDRLNREIAPLTGVHYEILNFSVAGWGPVACLTEIEKRVFEFEPDAIIYIGINEFNWVVKELTEETMGEFTIPYPELSRIAQSTGVDKSMDLNEIRTRLWPRHAELLSWVYDRIVRVCNKRNVLPIAAFIPIPTEIPPETKEESETEVDLGRKSGFVVIDMLDTYASLPKYDGIWLAPWDRHPNAEGHRMLADELYAGLLRELRLGEGSKEPRVEALGSSR